LQAKGEHPAPCARHCEATAFRIVIRNLKAQLAQPAVQQEPVASQWGSEKYDEHQRAWCVYYERWTDFPPLMDDYEAGNESFVLAANKSVRWYESHTTDMYLRVSGNPIPGDNE
jgi:hypothetical protein